MAKKETVATIANRPGYKGSYRQGTARAEYADRMSQFVGKPLSAFVESATADCPFLTKKGTAEPVKGWVTFLTGANGPFVIK